MTRKKRIQRMTKAQVSGKEKNTLRRPPLMICLQLRFVDPEGVIRFFPKDFEAKIVYGENQKSEVKKVLDEKGTVVYRVSRDEAYRYKYFRLHFEPRENNHFIFEKPGEDKKAGTMGNTPKADKQAKDNEERFFKIPAHWSFLDSEWAVSTGGDESLYDNGDKQKKFLLTDNNKPRDIGSREEPIKTLLNPHWQYLRFEYFDRYYGHSDHDNKPISIPPITVAGFYDKEKTSRQNVRSNWTFTQGGDEKKTVQCIPWILQAEKDGSPKPRPDKDSMLQFEQPQETYVVSEDKDKRSIEILTRPLSQENSQKHGDNLKPCANRLKYYDLPERWQSKNYWCRLSEEKEETGFFDKMADKKTVRDKPLIFSLDDIVLTDDKVAPIDLRDTDPVALFYHEFLDPSSDGDAVGTGGRDNAKYLKSGLYKPGPDKVEAAKQAKLEKEARDPAKDKRKQREEKAAREQAETQAERQGANDDDIAAAGDQAVANVANDADAQKRIEEAGDNAASAATKKALSSGSLKTSSDNCEYQSDPSGNAEKKAKTKQRAVEEKPLREEGERKQREKEENDARKAAEDAARDEGKTAKEIKSAGNRAAREVANDTEAQERITSAGNTEAQKVDSDPQATQRITDAGKAAAEAAVAFPYSDVKRDEKVPNYINDYPHWTRLLTSKGNIFEVFDKRTKDGDVVGARAAVRWVDATPDGVGVAAGTELSPRPSVFPAKDEQESSYFILQPFFEQRFFVRSKSGHSSANRPQGFYDEWNSPIAHGEAKVASNARAEMALVRCTGFTGENEESAVFRYHRMSFDYTSETSLLNPPSNPPQDLDDRRVKWTTNFLTTCADRWNGNDGTNTTRAKIIEKKDDDPKLRSQVVTFIQELAKKLAHFDTKTIAESKRKPTATDPLNTDGSEVPDTAAVGGTSAMNSVKGTGKFRVKAGADDPAGRGFAAAHEIGHTGGQPDDYAPSVKGQLGFGSNHVQGTPYVLDSRAMMKGNRQVRGRSFWHITEWLRELKPLKDKKFLVEHGGYNYEVPHYNHDDRPGRNYTHWPVMGKVFHQPNQPVNYDAFLYFLGDDAYRKTVLPGDPDGIMVIMVKILFKFGGYTNKDNIIKYIFNKVQQKLDVAMNQNRVYAQFSLNGIDRGTTNTFTKCMLHFSPRFEVKNYLSHLKVEIKTPDTPDPGNIAWLYEDSTGNDVGDFTWCQLYGLIDDETITDDTVVSIYDYDANDWALEEKLKDIDFLLPEFDGTVAPRTIEYPFLHKPSDLNELELPIRRLTNVVFRRFCELLDLSHKSTDSNAYDKADSYKRIVNACVNSDVNPTMTRT